MTRRPGSRTAPCCATASSTRSADPNESAARPQARAVLGQHRVPGGAAVYAPATRSRGPAVTHLSSSAIRFATRYGIEPDNRTQLGDLLDRRHRDPH
jgi:hypothetical protein